MITYAESSLEQQQYCLEKDEVDNKPEWEDDVGNFVWCATILDGVSKHQVIVNIKANF